MEVANTTTLAESVTAVNNATTSCLDNDPPDIILYYFVTGGVMLNILGLLGIIGNVISMIILSRPQMKSSINYLLIGLARVDTGLIIASILIFGLPAIHPYTGYMFTYYYIVHPHIAPVLYPLATALQTASVYLTVTVSVDRYVAVCNPLRARSVCTYGRARLYVLLIVVFSVVYNLPKLWEIRIQVEETNDHVIVYCIRPSTFRNNKLYITLYVHWCYLVFLYLIPFLFLFVLNTAIYLKIREANRERARLSRHQRREIGLAVMLIIVVAVFFACNLLPLFINLIECFYEDMSDHHAVPLDYMIKTSNLLVTINSSVNFIIYVTFGEKFKRLFLMLFCSNGIFLRIGRDSPDGGVQDDSFASNGDRQSLRLHRYNTMTSYRNGSTVSFGRSSTLRGSRARAIGNSSAPCVYYPASVNNRDVVSVQTSVPPPEWEQYSTSTTIF